jgi:signal transduction histidine kinase
MLSRLQAAYQTQRRFVADASHELRTPLTSIRGNLNLLERQPPIAEADRVAVLADLVSETERLARLVNDLLALARSDTGRTLARQAVPLRPLIAEVVRRLAVLHPDRVIREEAHGNAVVLGDRDALTQLLLILLDNALKFTPATGLIAARSAVHHDTVTLEVRDTGAGIAPADLPHIFDRFYQGDLARAGTGAGLGLAIARTIVDGLNGTIAVESEPGRGTRFTVTLPLSLWEMGR